MRLKRKLNKIVIISALLLNFGIFMGSASLVSAQNTCLPGNSLCTPAGGNSTGGVGNAGANTTTTNLGENCNKDKNNLQNCLKNNKLVVRLREVVNFLAAGVGVLVVMMLIIGGIQYSSAGDNPTKVQAAKQRLLNAILGLLAFAFLWSFLQWLIPGGLFNL